MFIRNTVERKEKPTNAIIVKFAVFLGTPCTYSASAYLQDLCYFNPLLFD